MSRGFAGRAIGKLRPNSDLMTEFHTETLPKFGKACKKSLRRCDAGRTLVADRLRRRPIPTEAIGSAATHPSLRGALATKQSRGHNMRGASNPDGRTAAPGLLRFARNDGQGIGSLVSACRLRLSRECEAD